MNAADSVAVHDLLIGYFRGFDERRTDDSFLKETFTADAQWRFPRGDATGIEELIERREGGARPVGADSSFRLERARRVRW